MALLIENSGYVFLIRLDLIFSMSLWKEFQLLQILNDLSIRHLIKLILYENYVIFIFSPILFFSNFHIIFPFFSEDLPQKLRRRLNCESPTAWQEIKYTKVTEDLFVKKKMV